MAEQREKFSGVSELAKDASASLEHLCNTLDLISYKPRNVHNLKNSLVLLEMGVEKLTQTINSTIDVDFSQLQPILKLCSVVSQGFYQQIINSCSQSTRSTRSTRSTQPNSNVKGYREWSTLRYMDDDISLFSLRINCYLSAVYVALFHQEVLEPSDIEELEKYQNLIIDAPDHLRYHLEVVEEHLQRMDEHDPGEPHIAGMDPHVAKQESSSIAHYLQVCDTLPNVSHMKLASHPLHRSCASDFSSESEDREEEERGYENDIDARIHALLELMGELQHEILEDTKRAQSSVESATRLSKNQKRWLEDHKTLKILYQVQSAQKERISKIEMHSTADRTLQVCGSGNNNPVDVVSIIGDKEGKKGHEARHLAGNWKDKTVKFFTSSHDKAISKSRDLSSAEVTSEKADTAGKLNTVEPYIMTETVREARLQRFKNQPSRIY